MSVRVCTSVYECVRVCMSVCVCALALLLLRAYG